MPAPTAFMSAPLAPGVSAAERAKNAFVAWLTATGKSYPPIRTSAPDSATMALSLTGAELWPPLLVTSNWKS